MSASAVLNGFVALLLALVAAQERAAAEARAAAALQIAVLDAILVETGPDCAVDADGRFDGDGCLCRDFDSQADAQSYFERAGVPAGRWPLDFDGDGAFCEEVLGG